MLLIANFLAVTRALQEVATPVEPSEADRREVYENLRLNDQPVDAPFEADLGGFLNRYRLAGYDLEIDAPRYVPLDIAYYDLQRWMRATVEPYVANASEERRATAGGQ